MDLRSEKCKTCIHTNVCRRDLNMVGEVFVSGNPMVFDNKKLFKEWEKRKAQGFPCDEYIAKRDYTPRGTYQCFHCGSYSVVWEADFDFSDYGYDGEGIVHFCHCANCGADIEYKVRLDDDKE